MPRGDIDRFELATITTTAKVEPFIQEQRTSETTCGLYGSSWCRYGCAPCRQHLADIDVRLVGSILIERERGIGFIRVAMRASSRRRILVGG